MKLKGQGPMADNIKKVIEDDGTIHYYLGDLHHNPDGPAVIGFAGRHKEYWFKGLRHRIDGPAIKYLDGDYEYWQLVVVQIRTYNMQWQSIAEGKAKDGWERKGCQTKHQPSLPPKMVNNTKDYYTGPIGGCFIYTKSAKKRYVNQIYCRNNS